jgi:hypothetical protein
MRANPNSINVFSMPTGQYAVIKTDPRAPQLAHFLESKGRMVWVGSEKNKAFVS